MHDRVLAAPENGQPGTVAHIAPPNRWACKAALCQLKFTVSSLPRVALGKPFVKGIYSFALSPWFTANWVFRFP
jgi:hypothetical protein